MIKGPLIPELYALKNLYYTTVRIQLFTKDDIDDGCGTGFFFHFHEMDENNQGYLITLLVTNRHVIEGAHTASLVLHLGPEENGIPMGGLYDLDIEDLSKKFRFHPDPDIDLCAMDITPYLTAIEEETEKPVHYQAFSEQHIPLPDELKQIFPASDVFMVGYPDGLWDESNNLPITRKGVTASHPFYDFNDKSRGVVDIGTYAGSSGSPIILYEPGIPTYDAPPKPIFHLLGILESFPHINAEGKITEKKIPSAKEKTTLTKIPIHLGYYIKAEELYALEKLFMTT
jgi:hypothetical protein